MRDEKHLNFKWYFKPFEAKDIKAETFDDFSSVNIPHNAVDTPLNHFDERMTHGIFSYGKLIQPKEEWKTKIVQLKFEGVAHQADIYLKYTWLER
jgi:beta-galactosidase